MAYHDLFSGECSIPLCAKPDKFSPRLVVQSLVFNFRDNAHQFFGRVLETINNPYWNE